MKIKINPEFRELIPPLSRDEFAALEASVVAEGCRDAIVVWDGVIVDGHNRYDICQKHRIEFNVVEKTFASDDEAKIWIIQNQLSRRNILPQVRLELALTLKPLIAARAKERQGARTDLSNIPQATGGMLETREEIAKIAGVSRDTVQKVTVIKRDGSKEINEQLSQGKISIRKAYETVREEKRKAVGPADGFSDKRPIHRLCSDPDLPPSFGLQFARMAIMDLERIHDDDLERDQGLTLVDQWLKTHWKKVHN
jgi:ParB-like chromosome segregation protein Spo0J